ncbi:MAG TPA: dihydroorotase, partial [Puia sp.]|nr:dihydroorotase [Puia sp.]
ISSPKSLEYIKRAKESGLEVSCSVTPYHLCFTDGDLLDYDTNLKVYPPLRTQSAVEALRQGIIDGTIDCIATHHLPHEYDSKVLEFEYAKFGMTGLETSYAILKWVFPGMKEEKMVDLLSTNARKIFSMANPKIEKGQSACLTMFNPGSSWQLTAENSRSKSKNTPFFGKSFTGKPVGIINGEKLFLNN